MMDLGQEEIRVTGRSSPCRSASPWEGVYEAKGEDQLSWRQEEPTLSLEVVRRLCPPGGRVVDVGGGTSLLAGRLVEAGYEVTVVDVSRAALRRARERAGALAERVQWVHGDVAAADLELPRCDLWHDRAAFHSAARDGGRGR